MYSWWWVRLSPETCRVKPLRRIKRNCCILLDLFHYYKAWCSEPQILKTHLSQFFLEWEMFQKKIWREYLNTYVIFKNFFPQKSYRLWDKVGKYCRAGQATDDNMAHAHCMLDTNTHSTYVILIAFPLQKWLHERASTLRYTYIACLVLTETTVSISHTLILCSPDPTLSSLFDQTNNRRILFYLVNIIRHFLSARLPN